MTKVKSPFEQHIASAENPVKAAEMFVSGAEDSKTLATTAENFIGTAKIHIAGAEALISSPENHIVNLQSAAETAEKHLNKVANFVGAEDKIQKRPKG